MVIGTVTVITLYLLANLAYLMTLPLDRHSARARRPRRNFYPGGDLPALWSGINGDRNYDFHPGNHQCAGPDRAQRLLCDGAPTFFFRFAEKLNSQKVPAGALWLQGLWAVLLVLPRTYDPNTHVWGNLYGNLLEYVISAALIFYVLTVSAVFRLRWKRPQAVQTVSDLGLSRGTGRIYRDRRNHSDCVLRISADDHVARAAHRGARNSGLLAGPGRGRKTV